jgi:hypothetical protein
VAGHRWFVDEPRSTKQCQGLRGLALRVSGGGPTGVDQRGQVIDVYVSQRRGPRLGAQVLHRSPDRPRRPDRGRHRPGAGFGERDRGPGSCRDARHRPGREQPCRVRPWPTEDTAQADAWTEDRANRERGGPGGTRWSRTCVVAATSSLSTPPRCSGWPPHSKNSRPPSDQHRRLRGPRSRPGLPRDQATQQSLSGFCDTGVLGRVDDGPDDRLLATVNRQREDVRPAVVAGRVEVVAPPGHLVEVKVRDK